METAEQNLRASELDPDDRIGRLPDSVLSHILSFLPTKHAVATSVLSKRWEFLWKQVHSFYFDDNMPSIRQRVAQSAGRHMTFPECIERVMLLRNTQFSIEKFHIRCSRFNDIHNHINTWITSAIVAGVRNLSLCVRTGEMILLPRELFTCNRLVELNLSGGHVLIKAQRVCFPYLKTLHLSSVRYQNDAAVSQLISSCLVLEILFIQRSGIDNVSNFDISSHTLKRLTINFYCHVTSDFRQLHVALKLDTPQLQFLTIWGHLNEMYNVKELPYLHEANVTARQDSGFDFFRSLQNIKVLSLSTIAMQHEGPFASQCFGTIFKSFCNLTHLKLGAKFCLMGHLQVIFDTTENLESLTYQENENSSHLPPQSIRTNRVEVTKPLMSRLSSVSLVGFTGGRCNMELSGYILKNAKVLTNMEIRCRSETSVENKFNLLQKISEIPRVSPTCKIMFS